jgi:hypothetical protein
MQRNVKNIISMFENLCKENRMPYFSPNLKDRGAYNSYELVNIMDISTKNFTKNNNITAKELINNTLNCTSSKTNTYVGSENTIFCQNNNTTNQLRNNTLMCVLTNETNINNVCVTNSENIINNACVADTCETKTCETDVPSSKINTYNTFITSNQTTNILRQEISTIIHCNQYGTKEDRFYLSPIFSESRFNNISGESIANDDDYHRNLTKQKIYQKNMYFAEGSHEYPHPHTDPYYKTNKYHFALNSRVKLKLCTHNLLFYLIHHLHCYSLIMVYFLNEL